MLSLKLMQSCSVGTQARRQDVDTNIDIFLTEGTLCDLCAHFLVDTVLKFVWNKVFDCISQSTNRSPNGFFLKSLSVCLGRCDKHQGENSLKVFLTYCSFSGISQYLLSGFRVQSVFIFFTDGEFTRHRLMIHLYITLYNIYLQ